MISLRRKLSAGRGDGVLDETVGPFGVDHGDAQSQDQVTVRFAVDSNDVRGAAAPETTVTLGRMASASDGSREADGAEDADPSLRVAEVQENARSQPEQLVGDTAADEQDDGNMLFGASSNETDDEAAGFQHHALPAGSPFEVVLPAVDDMMKLPDGPYFLVAPIIYRCPFGADVLQPATLPMPSGPDLPQNLQLEGALWSASPGVCAFENMKFEDRRTLTSDEVRALLGGSEAERPGITVDPKPLRVIVAIRCVQRFWQLTVS